MIAIHDRDKIKEGIEIGQSLKQTELIIAMLGDGKTPAEIESFCHIPISEIQAVQESNKESQYGVPAMGAPRRYHEQKTNPFQTYRSKKSCRPQPDSFM
jgi:hypothetical protein